MLRAVGSTDATVGGGKSRKSGRGAGNGKGPNSGGGGGGTDPDFASVVALLHLDGADGGTTFTDVIGKTWSSSDVTTVTGVKKYGTASASFPGTGSQALIRSGTTPDPIYDFGTGDLTVECWINPTGAQTSCILGQRNSVSGLGWEVFIAADNSTYAQGTGSFVQTAAGIITPGGWQHWAWTRASGVSSIYIDGVCRATGTVTTTNGSTYALTMGLRANPSPAPFLYTGYLDDVRITKGVARYTGTSVGTTYFTPPTAAFPDS